MDSLGSRPAAIDPESKPRFRERRSRVRHKVHTPAYASLHGYAPGMPLDLSEILDIHEDGMAVQTCAEKTVGENLNLWIDLSETAAYLHMTGQVVWSDKSGRTGVRFSDVPEISQSQLREWLFANMIAACANRGTAQASSGSSLSSLGPIEESPASDYTGVLAALVAVQRELETARPDAAAALQLITERALSLTQATGAAIALIPERDQQSADAKVMVCRARAGRDAPDLGAKLQAGSGFSGECIRSGVLLRCDDSEIDSRVDRENCRALGIRSMIAVPIRLETGVVGLLEVFAPQPNAFGLNENTVLRNLSEAASALLKPASTAASVEPEISRQTEAEPDDDVYQEPVPRKSKHFLPWSQIFLLALVVITLSLVVIWLLRTQPIVRPGSGDLHSDKRPQPTSPVSQAMTSPGGIQEVRRLADQGDSAAQFAYGVHFFAGEDVPQDYAEAVRWFSKAAEQNNVMAQATLAACYWAGQGVPRDIGKAYFWAVIAQAGGDEASKTRVALLASRMNHPQVVAAQEQADDWIRQHQLSSQNLMTPADPNSPGAR